MTDRRSERIENTPDGGYVITFDPPIELDVVHIDDLMEQWHNDPESLTTFEEFIIRSRGWSIEQFDNWAETRREPDA